MKIGRGALIVSLVLGILATPLVASDAEHASKVYRIGFLGDPAGFMAAAFWHELRTLGYREGENIVIEQRDPHATHDRNTALAVELVSLNVDVIVTTSTPSARAAMEATRTIPIAMGVSGDPVGTGLVASLARPGGNLTGLSLQWGEGIVGKWLELLEEAVPHLSTVAVLHNPGSSLVRRQVKELEVSAGTRGLKLRLIEVREAQALEPAFKQARRHAQAVLVLPDPLIEGEHRRRVIALAPSIGFPTCTRCSRAWTEAA